MKVLAQIGLAATIGLSCTIHAGIVAPIPDVGSHSLKVLTPRVLELSAILAVAERSDYTQHWDFRKKLPDASSFQIFINGMKQDGAIKEIGFRQRPRYAPLAKWDLRVEASLFLTLRFPIEPGAKVEVAIVDSLMPVTGARFTALASGSRHSPVLHVSQAGYQIGAMKFARAGYYLGTQGELNLSDFSDFYLRDESTGAIVFRAQTHRTKDKGFTYQTPPCQQVLLLDFSRFDQPGTYKVGIEGVGESHSFTISNGYFTCLARTYALGLYHQRCGCQVGLPFSRFQHAPCHTSLAKVPEPGDKKIWNLIRSISDKDHEQQTAPPLDSARDALYPFRRKGEIDVSGGHHDAGDYSKYVVNSAQLIHTLTYATDAFPGVNRIDNLGIPESGNGIPDSLDIAAYEAAFLAKMQDSDGGFYFLVYPQERAYETDVTPDKGDPQTVFPKTTASTAAAAAALCQIASSPTFRNHFPILAARYLRQAEIGWRFLRQAEESHGKIGAYQTISHYGNLFMDRDEITWLATELYLATGEQRYHDYVLRNFKPGSSETVHWGWLRLRDGYGAAARSYSAAVQSGRRSPSDLHQGHLRACKRAIDEWATQLAHYTHASAYGVAFPLESKRHRVSGWHFAAADTFDLVASSNESGARPSSIESAAAANLAYETGANAVDVCYLTGLGVRRQYEIVHQWALNDREQLPISGIPLGSLQTGFRWNHRYKDVLGKLSHPSDGASDSPYSFYHRWADTYNVSTEFTIVQQGKALAAALCLMAQSPLQSQKWEAPAAKIAKSSDGYSLTLPENLNLNLDDAIVVWEAEGFVSPHTGRTLPVNRNRSAWISVEAHWPDGRRAFATLERP